ncbi:MAG: hypothetical protein WD278_00945 [Pirellulales bacterium]
MFAVGGLCGPALAGDDAAGDLAGPLEVLRSVGPMGAGNEAAARAWREVVKADADDLTEVLAALDGAGPLAANWIRSAVDAIAERQVRAGGELPKDKLEAFIHDTEHSPRGRRMAFEWLTRVDASAPDRLIPGLLNDSSVEFRRDAVARLLAEAESLAGMNDEASKAAAAEVYRKALSGARDVDQVQQIKGELEKLGHNVDLARHFGFLLDWKLIGPFDNADEKGFDVVYPPEEVLDPAAEYEGKPGSNGSRVVQWVDHSSKNEFGQVDLNEALGKANGVAAYALAEFDSAEQQEVELRLGSVNAVKLWLNGDLLHQHRVYHSGAQMDQYIAWGLLKPGRNLILLKVCQNEQAEEWAQAWAFQLRICDSAGTAILSRDRREQQP